MSFAAETETEDVQVHYSIRLELVSRLRSLLADRIHYVVSSTHSDAFSTTTMSAGKARKSLTGIVRLAIAVRLETILRILTLERELQRLS